MKIGGLDFSKLRDNDDKENRRNVIWAVVALFLCIGFCIYFLIDFIIRVF